MAWGAEAASLLAAFLLAGCGAGGALARVNGTPITRSMLNAREHMTQVLKPGSRPSSTPTLHQLVNETLVIAWAQQHHVPGPSSVSVNQALTTIAAAAGGNRALTARLTDAGESRTALRGFVSRELRLEAVFRRVAGTKTEPSRAAVARYYATHRARFTSPPTVLAREIVVGSSGRAQDLLTELRHGASFSALALRASTEVRTRAAGGSLGYVAPSADPTLSASVRRLLRTLKPGRMGIAHSPRGYSIVEVQAERPGQPVPLSNVAGIIRTELVTEREDAVFQQFVKHLRSRARVVIGS